MSNTAYNKGARLERRAREVLEANGYVVYRSAGSKGAVDLVAFPVERNIPLPRLIQVKANRAGSLRELKRLKRRLRVPASLEVWLYRDGRRAPEVIFVV